MSGYLYQVWYSTKYSKGVLWIVVGANTPIEACEKGEMLLRDAGQDGVIEIVGVERLV